MIDFDKEEFLRRLDLRLQSMANMLAYHEKWIGVSLLPSKQSIKYGEDIDNATKSFLDYISKYDKEIQEYFDKLRDKYNNDGN